MEKPIFEESPDSCVDINFIGKKSRFYFDRRDYGLIRIVNDVCLRSRDIEYLRRQYYGYFHPHGIKEMAESKSLRIAYAMVHLLTSLEVGGVDERLGALRSLRSEVLDTAEGPLPKNTTRALMQIMKEIVRNRLNYKKQLELAHDFRITASGKPRIVLKQLKKYHLLEMPEEWNQLSFDDHVHDVNTKGRKSSTHMIMDAWIKGIRRLRVVHYNYIEARSVAELLESAQIMDIDIRIGIEFSARFRNKYVNLIWTPRGFPDSQAFLCFLEEPKMVELMNEGHKVSAYQQAYVMSLLQAFNEKHLPVLNKLYDMEIAPLDANEFVSFVGIGQKSVLHLEKFIYQKILLFLKIKAEQLRTAYNNADSQERARIEKWFDEANTKDFETIISEYLKPSNNPEIPNPTEPQDGPDIPVLLRLSSTVILNLLSTLWTGYRITLNLSNLEVEDVLEIVYDSNGMVSRLELFNLKDWAAGKTSQIPDINRLQEAINKQSPIELKRLILEIIEKVKEKNLADKNARIEKLNAILYDIISLQVMYKGKPLKARIGSDSTGQSRALHGMGLAVIQTLPKRARKQIRRDIGTGREIIPIHITAFEQQTFLVDDHVNKKGNLFWRIAESIPFFRRIGYTRKDEWAVQGDATRMDPDGNVVTLGGIQKEVINEIYINPQDSSGVTKGIPLIYLNSHIRNMLKVLIGFIPAFLTFFYTKDWWLLSYFGAFIWFGITGIRNILQSVLGGGGFRRSPMLRWNAYVSWDRIADSLLFTGFSVPLLDYIVKTAVMDNIFGVTTTTNPILLYTAIALTNGIYLSSHNAFRGLQKAAVYGNLFRTVLSIPIAVSINFIAEVFLTSTGTAGAPLVLQKWAAIISKASSDIVAGIIEGTADRYKNIKMRYKEYRKKLTELIDIHSSLELLFPDVRDIELLGYPNNSQKKTSAEIRDLEKIISIHALDALYFWMYQPRSRTALRHLLDSISEEERQIWVSSQFVLLRKKEISQMLIDGVLGNDFAKALSFYLSSYPEYLEAMKKFA